MRMKQVWFVFFMFFSGVANAQTAAPTCQRTDLFAFPSFANGPDHTFNVAISFRNDSDHACRANRALEPLSPVPDRVPGMPPPVTHWPRTEDSPLVLDPGQSASMTYRWTTVPAVAGQPCLKVQWLTGPMLLVTPALLPPLCSDILSGPLVPDGSAPLASLQDLELSSPKESFFDGEAFALQARRNSLAQPSPTQSAFAPYEAGSRSEPLPDFYRLSRSPNGDTRFDQVDARVRPCFGVHPPATTGPDGLPCVRFDSGSGSHWGSAGVHQFIVVRASGQTEGIVLHRSNTLAITVLTPETLVRNWGSRVSGVAVALNLDRKTYVLGEDIPLHIALENFSATTPVHSWSPLWDPGMATTLNVLDAQGSPLKQGEACFNMYTGHGFGPTMPVVLGKPVYIEDACTSGFLQAPLKPGLYTFVVTWSSLVDSIPSPVAVNVKARAEVEIVP